MLFAWFDFIRRKTVVFLDPWWCSKRQHLANDNIMHDEVLNVYGDWLEHMEQHSRRGVEVPFFDLR